MDQQTIIISIAFAVAGLLVGILMYMLAKHQIKIRDKQFPMLREDYPVDLLEKKSSFVLFELCFALTYGLSYLVLHDNLVSVIFTIVLATCCIDLSAVDLAIRRVPNEMLLIIMIAGLANDIANPLLYNGKVKDKLIFSAIGIAVSFFIFYIPKMFGLYMGNGDIKLSASLGFALGFAGYVQAMVIMALVSILMLIVLVVTKKGGLKTKTPMGPALSVGAVVTAMYMLPSLAGVSLS